MYFDVRNQLVYNLTFKVMCRSEPHSCFPNFMRGSMNSVTAKRELIHISDRKDGNPFTERIGNTKGLEVLKKTISSI